MTRCVTGTNLKRVVLSFFSLLSFTNVSVMKSLLSFFVAIEFEFKVVKWTLKLLPIIVESVIGLLLRSLITIGLLLDVLSDLIRIDAE